MKRRKLRNTPANWEVYDTLNGCRIGIYTVKKNADRRRLKEIRDRDLLQNGVIVRHVS